MKKLHFPSVLLTFGLYTLTSLLLFAFIEKKFTGLDVNMA